MIRKLSLSRLQRVMIGLILVAMSLLLFPRPQSLLWAATLLCFVWTTAFVEPPAKASTLRDVYQSSRAGWRILASGKLMILVSNALLFYTLYRQYGNGGVTEAHES